MSQATHTFVHSLNCRDNNCKGSCRSPAQYSSQSFPKAPPLVYEKTGYESWEKNHNDNMNYHTYQMNYVPPDKNVPYLLLPARLSLIWVNKWTIALIILFVRLLFFLISFKKDMVNAEEKMHDAYTIIQYTANSLVLMPRSTAIGTNKVIALGIENSVRALNKTLILIILGVQHIILFFIEMIIHTWTCLLELSIQGGIKIIADVVEKISKFVNKVLKSIEKDILAGIQEINKGIASILNTIEKTAKILGKNIKVPTLSIPIEEKISNFSIPNNYDDELRKLGDRISLEPLKNTVKSSIAIPFYELRKLINNTLSNYSFDSSLLPVPSVDEFAIYSDNGDIDKVFKRLSNDIYTAVHSILLVLVILAILAIVPFAIKEWWNWKRLQSKAAMVWSIFSITKTFDPTEFILTVAYPWSTLLGLKFSSAFRNQHHKILIRWFISYIFHPSSLFVLFLGILGFISCGLQMILLSIMKKSLLSSPEENVPLNVSEKLQAASLKWSNDVNNVLNQTAVDLNSHIFGWVYASTQSINNTLNVFMETTTDSFKKIFGGTVLYQPILGVLDCMLFIKLRGIEKGLTWIHQNARISSPIIPNNILTSFVENSTSHTDFVSAAKSLNQKFYSILNTLIAGYEKSIIFEAKISFVLVSAWILIFVLGLLRIIFARKPVVRGLGGGPYSEFPSRAISNPIFKNKDEYDYIPSSAPRYTADPAKNAKIPPEFSKGPFIVDDNISDFAKYEPSGAVVEQYKSKNDKYRNRNL
ncbi:hypothetical protein PNEG_03049 [Pneumocystis murina B123]|uniref:Plasma membrane fusion protein PRM1 n=1 Tax=Pneumocystis murina (strain B123) TaxID=1069680 RepID=M7NMW6_PNEMU|nr:hypothetical protein PNEG_03049 [Pneumocystis murina B123]EMR08572.1 hypothetical protein PNEG_03049 [Pneumocystis murina B123]